MNKNIILGILNSVAIAVVLGLFVYTKVLFKRPAITEDQMRKSLIKNQKIPDVVTAKHVVAKLDPLTANLDPYPDERGKQKFHNIAMTLGVELRSKGDLAKFEIVKPVIMDKIIQNLSKKKFEDLNQVQGRYVFRSQIIDAANEFLGAPVVTEIYFSDFLLQ